MADKFLNQEGLTHFAEKLKSDVYPIRVINISRADYEALPAAEKQDATKMYIIED